MLSMFVKHDVLFLAIFPKLVLLLAWLSEAKQDPSQWHLCIVPDPSKFFVYVALLASQVFYVR